MTNQLAVSFLKSWIHKTKRSKTWIRFKKSVKKNIKRKIQEEFSYKMDNDR